jgi:spore maturation protein CgeB
MTLETRPLRILYVAPLANGSFGLYRKKSLERLGHTIIPIDLARYESHGNPLWAKIRYRLQIGGTVSRLNQTVLHLAHEHNVDVAWFDKPLFIRIGTLQALRAQGIVTVDYMIDNPFGPRRDPGFRLYIRTIPDYDIHAQQRDSSVAEYRRRGAPRVVKVQTAYEPSVHFAPPAKWSDKDRTRGVSFIGTPYDDRADFLTQLWAKYGLPVVITGPRVWEKKLGREALAALYPQSGEFFDDAYREGIWRSKINLSFLTHSNQDEYAHKSFEIAACGGFLLAERSAGHAERFDEDREAVFFSGVEECADKCRFYLSNESARNRISQAGQRRAIASGYDNDTQMRRILEAVYDTLAAQQGSRP